MQRSFQPFARFHPYWHVQVLEGGFTDHDRFVYLPIGADDAARDSGHTILFRSANDRRSYEGMPRVWQEVMLALFLRKKLIDQTRVNMLKDWKHSGFSIESETRLFNKIDREILGQYIVGGATCAEKIQYDPDNDTVTWSSSPKGYYKGRIETFKGFEFVAQLVAHLPPRRLQLVRRYGAYSGKVRNQWQQRSGIYYLAPESWKHTHQLRTSTNQEAKPAAVDSPEVPDAWSKLRRQSWARLLQKVYEVDPFICPKCQGTMTVVAIIEDPAELTKIIEWAKKQEQDTQPSVCARSPPDLALLPV